ncbi:MAG: hypothetical protein J2P37_17570 [Ktedonobacteraceae bacterium]|nr:hypothetical protein [Ktedonobacteraceae bacterium]
MNEIDASLVAGAIRRMAPHTITVEAIELHPQTHQLGVKCRYHGPTFQQDQDLFLHGMQLWITSRFAWSRLRKLLLKKA